jgi:hypothetical protein
MLSVNLCTNVKTTRDEANLSLCLNGFTYLLDIYNGFLVTTDFAKRWKCLGSVIRRTTLLLYNTFYCLSENALFKLPQLKISLKVAYRALYIGICTFWMFSFRTVVHWPSSKTKTIYKEPQKTDYIQATIRENVSSVDSLRMLRAPLCLSRTLTIQQEAVFLTWEILLTLFPQLSTLHPEGPETGHLGKGFLGFRLPSFKCWDSS